MDPARGRTASYYCSRISVAGVGGLSVSKIDTPPTLLSITAGEERLMIFMPSKKAVSPLIGPSLNL
jgi:hypothetical protein